MKNPLVSICVVTYNQQQYIRNCLVSVVTQEVDCDVEVLVGDDGSSDATCEIIESVAKEFPGKITLFRHAVNLGPTGNYQFLIEKAKGWTGKALCSVDDDLTRFSKSDNFASPK